MTGPAAVWADTRDGRAPVTTARAGLEWETCCHTPRLESGSGEIWEAWGGADRGVDRRGL